MFEKYYESPAYGEWCERVYGKNLSQLGMVTMSELEILYHEVDLPPDSHILDMGCGPGYLSAEVANHYHSRLTGIDMDVGSISHARKTFSNNPAYNFILGDGSKFPFEASGFDLVCFMDSLHFTRTTENLRALLDKCVTMLEPNGKLAIFWSQNKMYEQELREPVAYHTQVALWAISNNFPFHLVDLTEAQRGFWLKALNEVIAMEKELQSEIPDTYERLKVECTSYVNGDSSKLNVSIDGNRWLYIIHPVDI